MTFNLTPIEWIAFLLAALTIIKIVVLVVKKSIWMDKVAVPIYGNPNVSGPIMLILAAIVFYYLIQVFNIVQIFAVMTFTALIMASSFMFYGKEMMPVFKKIINKPFSVWIWIYSLAWLALSVWVLVEIF